MKFLFVAMAIFFAREGHAAEPCSFVSAVPSQSSVRVGSNGSTVTTFVAVPSQSSCRQMWALNGTSIAVNATSVSLTSSSLVSGSNTLTASVSNGEATAVRTWTVARNSVPSCALLAPAAASVRLPVNVEARFSIVASDADSDPLTVTWRLISSLRDSTSRLTAFDVSADPASPSLSWTPTSGQVGQHRLDVQVSDGYDSTYCGWGVSVAETCTVTGAFPNSSIVNLPVDPSGSVLFGFRGVGGSCRATWRLNGQVLPTSEFAIPISSRQLAPANNVLEVEFSNPGSSSRRSWSLRKTQP